MARLDQSVAILARERVISMARVIRILAIGVTLSLACVACTSGGGSGFTHELPARQFKHLNQFKSIDSNEERLISADEFPAKSQTPKVIGEIRKGPYRLIAYIQGDACGLRVADVTNSSRSLIHITAAWPRSDSEGSASYPAGPYNSASAAGVNGSRTWASLRCSNSAMVIDYSSPDHGSASDRRGNISIKERHKNLGALTVIVGSRAARESILAHVQQRQQ